MKARLTVEEIKAFTLDDGEVQRDVFDEAGPPGFGVRIGKKAKTFFYAYRTPEGKKRRLTLGEFPDVGLRDARTKAEAHRGKRDDPGGVREQERRLGSFAGLVSEFKEKYRHRVRSSTWVEYERQLDVLVNGDGELEAWGELPISAITRSRVKLHLEKKAAKAPYASNRLRAVLGIVFSWANDEELLDRNPVLKVKPFGEEQERDRVLKHQEIRSLWKALDREQPLTRAYFHMLFLTGLRRSEVLRARWEDLDNERGVWTIERTATKSGFRLDVPITDAMREVFEQLQALTGNTPFVFASMYSGDREPKPIVGTSKSKARIARRAGVDGWRVHDIRRTVTTNLGELGIADNVQRAVLGHRIPGALKSYQHAKYALKKRAALEKWQAKLAEIVEADPAEVVAISTKRS